jgi:transcriptional regulator with XRE-family HTH domain
MDMRYRLPELMKDRHWTAYRVAKETGWRISTSTVSRIAKRKGKVGGFNPDVMEALMDAFQLGTLDELLERDGNKQAKRR